MFLLGEGGDQLAARSGKGFGSPEFSAGGGCRVRALAGTRWFHRESAVRSSRARMNAVGGIRTIGGSQRRLRATGGGDSAGGTQAPSGPTVAQAQGGDVFGALASRNARPGAGSTSAGRVATTLGGSVRTVV